MKHIKYYKNFKIYEEVSPEENLANFRKSLSEISPSEDPNKETNDVNNVNKLSWDVKNKQIKVFLDITGFSDNEQTTFGKAIIAWGALKNWRKGKYKNSSQQINHIGFIFSNDKVFHATTPKDDKPHQGILFENGEEIVNDPSHYMIYNLPGNQETIRNLAIKLLEDIDKYNKESKKATHSSSKYKVKEPGKFYDKPGILRELFGKWSKWLFPEKEKDLKFYCSELVSNFLVQAGVISLSELESLNESLDECDEVSPNKLCQLIMKKGVLAKLLVEYEDGNKKVIYPENIDNKQIRTLY